MDHLIGSNLGQYQIVEVIGRGSTSTVYKAFQPSLNRNVAVKVLMRSLGTDFEARFKREAQAIAQLQHPNILPIYDYGQHDELLFFATQYIENEVTLGDLIGRTPMEPVGALRLMVRLLDGLDYAHQRGIIHRDIKPSNVLMPQPHWPLLADFGIAKLLDDCPQLTPPGQTVGTAIYMAPEQANGRPADRRTDLYSAGVVLYEMLTGQVPFEGTTAVAVLLKHANDLPTSPRQLRPELPDVLEDAVMRALAKSPAQRHQTAVEMAYELERVAEQIRREQALRELIGVSAAATPADLYKTHDLIPEMQAISVKPQPVAARSTAPAAATQATPTSDYHRFDRIAALSLIVLIGLVTAGLTFSLLPNALARRPAPLAAQSTAVPLTTSVEATVGAALPTGAPSPEPTAAPMTETPSPEPAEPTAVPWPATAAPTREAPSPSPAEPTAAPRPATATAQPATETSAPSIEPAQSPTAPPPSAPETTPIVIREDGTVTILIEDTDWQGGYRYSAGRTYGGRTATWIYGQSTAYHTMRGLFPVDGQAQGTAMLRVEGVDSETRGSTLIRILVNGAEIYNGPNPLPDDDAAYETGTWTTYTWLFEASLLQPGQNEITISNLEQGAFGLPPFFMLDYAAVRFEQP